LDLVQDLCAGLLIAQRIAYLVADFENQVPAKIERGLSGDDALVLQCGQSVCIRVIARVPSPLAATSFGSVIATAI